MNIVPVNGGLQWLPLRSFSDSRSVYRHAPHNPSTDDVCPICRDPYASVLGGGCHAIRLENCGHVFGDKCFREWVTCYPRTCPYYNHTLPLELQYLTSSNDWIAHITERIVLYACSTTLWEFLDDLFLELLIQRAARTRRSKVNRALRSLSRGALETEEAELLRTTYSCMMFSLWINMAVLPILCVLFIGGLCSIWPTGYIAYVNDFVFKITLRLTVAIGCISVFIGIPFLFVVEGMLQLCLWRSVHGNKVRTVKMQ